MSAATLTVLEAIKARHSVRTFKGNFPAEKQAVIDQIVEEANNQDVPFGSPVLIANHPPGLGRLGVISNEAGWLISKIPTDTKEEDMHKAVYDVGYRLHFAVLRLVQNEIATVWIAGTYNETLAEESCPGYKVLGVVAYGEPTGSKGLLERAMGWMVGSSTRLPLQDLFYDGDNNCAFTEENAGEHLELLKAVQSCPSALNIQAWKLYITGKTIHLYNSATRPTCDFDIGISLATMMLLLKEQGKNPRLSVVENPPEVPEKYKGIYIITITYD